MRRALVGAAAAAAAAAVAAIGQMWLARWLRVLVPDQDYTAGNDTWPFELVLLAWYAATAALLGCVVARGVVGRARWRWSLAAPAGLGALVALHPAQDWAAGASAVPGDAVAAAGGAVLFGAVVGVAAGAAVLAWRSVARGAVVWVAWVWLIVLVAGAAYDPGRRGRDYVVTADPLGVLPLSWPGHESVEVMVRLLPPLALCTLLGWWARRRGDRLPLLGAVAGPLLLVAVYEAVSRLPTTGFTGDHYSLGEDLATWLLVTVLGVSAGALGVFAGRRRPAGQRAGEPAALVVILLMAVASLLMTAALVGVSSYRGGWLDAGAAGLAFGAGLALRRRAVLSGLAGACAALAGMAGLAVLAGLLGDRSQLLVVVPGIVGSLALAVLVGAFARGARGAAWFALAAGVLDVVEPLARSVAGGRVGSVGDGYAFSAVFGLLVIGTAVAVLTTIRNHPVALSAEGEAPRIGQ